MNIVIIGTGNTATVLGRRLKAAGHEILMIYGRNTKDATDLAYELDTASTNYWSVVPRSADVYLLAVSDIAIADVLRELHMPQGTVVHTAASVSKAVLQQAPHHGVFYPLQSLLKEAHWQPDIPIIIDASDAETMQQLQTLAHSITDKVMEADDDQRLKLHVAAVFCNNFVNHLYALAEDYCRKEGIAFALLLPLIRETAERLEAMPAAAAQTGPALRGDQNTIDRHRQLLLHHPHLRSVYDLFTDSIQKGTV